MPRQARFSSLLKIMTLGLALALPVALTAISAADARVGGGGSSGSRGSRTFSAPPSTSTAPSSARPMERTITQPSGPGSIGTAAQGNRGGMFGGIMNRPGLLGGLAAGFLGAGLFGMLFGHGLMGGLGGIGSIFGLLIQLAIIFFVVRFLMNWWQRRNQPAFAGNAPQPAGGFDPNAPHARSGLDGAGGAASGFGSGLGGMFGGGSAAPAGTPITITEADYQAFERLLRDIQTAWSHEDIGALRRLATPEMVSYFAEDLTANASRGVVNRVTDVKLLQGDLAEAWREGMNDYATVAMRFRLTDVTRDRSSGRVVEGSETPQEATEVWTFRRDGGGDWLLSAIQQS